MPYRFGFLGLGYRGDIRVPLGLYWENGKRKLEAIGIAGMMYGL